MKKAILSILLVTVMIFMAACGSSSSDSSSDKDDSDKSKKQSSSISYNYVSPSDLKGDTASGNASEASPDGSGEQGGNVPDAPPDGAGGQGGNGPGGGPGGGASTQSFDYSGSYSAALSVNGKTKKSDGEKITSSSTDKNAVLAKSGATLKLTDATIKKSGDDNNGDNCNFYGLNSSILAVGSKTKAYISDSSIASTSEGSNGIFSTDSAKVYANNVKIKTTKGNSSRGLDATYGGIIYGNKLDIDTAKEHCAALATDRGGGYISVTNSKLKTAGSGSPLIYSTGDIETDNTTGTASGSQIAGMEGLNRIVINNSTLKSTNDARSGSDPIKNGVILYQSTSGDADTATSEKAEFQAADSTLKTSISDGAMFYVTNTNAKVFLQNTKLDFDSKKVDLIDAVGNSNNWGTSGSNGGKVTFTCKDMTISGDIKTDDISSVDLYLKSGTKYTGKTKGGIGSDNMNVNISKDSTWVVSGDCTVSSLNVAKGGKVEDKDGKTITIKKGSKTLVKGDSDITVTVKGSYSTKVKKNSDTNVNADVLDRSAFDKYYKTETAFGKNN